ncbi:MAG: serine/threonine protein kinase [Kiritimatiellae bacterium]|nr:serine/threonine protein kinase [Kiritimatiellia bacterium]
MTEFRPDARIGDYRIVRLLGKGGMGAVYEALHTQLGTRCALKAFTLDHGHVELLKERFLAEGRILARLRHPNLVRVFDLNVDVATQTPYFVMDIVLGESGKPRTLADVEAGSADEARVARWFGQLAAALDCIHGEGVVHRDVKLSNVLLDAQGNVVLSDFGISRFCSAPLREELNVGSTSVSEEAPSGSLFMGTSGYMAPEVRRGEEATAASDAYSLGIVLFRLLTGIWYENRQKIWDLLEPFDGTWREILTKLLAEDPRERPNVLSPLAEQLHRSLARPCVRTRIRTRWMIIGLVAAAVLLVCAWLATRNFSGRGNSTVRTDDLFTIPAAAPED